MTSYVYDRNDRLLTETNGTKITTSTYDNNGNNLTRGDGTTQIVNTWDIEQRLIQSVTDASTTIYQYDPNGVRVSSKTNGVETRYLVDSNRPHASVVLEYNASGTPITEYTYGLNLIEQERGGVKSFYHVDGSGSTRFLTDSSGSVTDSYIYDAYGTTISSSGTTTNNYLYTGEQFDKNLGEYYLRARYYNPSQGRFTGRDPFDGMLEEPLSLNKYAYVHGNPINNTDPTGMFISMLEASSALSIIGVLAVGAYATYNIANSLHSLSGTAGNLGGNGSSNLSSQLKLLLLASVLKAANLASETEFETYGVPIMFSTNFYGGVSQEITTLHIWSAIAEQGKSPLLTLWRKDDTTPPPPGYTDRYWYNYPFAKFPEVDTNPCTLGKVGMKPNQKKKLGCDEYPFWSTYEGGTTNGKQGKVSLHLVPVKESEAQGPFLGKAQNAGVQVGVPFFDKFGVVALPFVNISSFWKNREGKNVY